MGWILALLAGGLVTFNAVVTPDKAADAATKALQKKFPGAQVKVVIAGKRGQDVLNGRFKRVDVELADLTLDELPIASQSASAQSGSAPVAANASVAARENVAANIGAAPSAQTAPAPPRAEVAPLVPRADGATSIAPARARNAKTPAAPKIKLGRAGEINISVSRFRWNKLPVERAVFHFENVEYDFNALKNRSQFVLVRAGAATMHLELAPDALTPFIEKRVANVSDASVSIGEGNLSVKGRRTLYGVAAPFEVAGAPGFVGAQVILRDPKLTVSGLGVPALVASPLLKSVNPLYSFADLKELPFDVKLTDVTAREGKLQIDGDLSLRRPGE